MKTVFIATNSRDTSNTAEVVNHLRKAGHRPIIYSADEVFDTSRELDFSLAPGAAKPELYYDGRELSPDTIGAAWLWRPYDFFRNPSEDKAKHLALKKELRDLQVGVIETTIPRSAWLNDPIHMRDANNKILQLLTARSLGFTIPETVVSNRWSRIRKLPTPLIMKMPVGLLHENNQSKMMFTTVLDEEKLDRLSYTRPFPGIFQTHIPKAREWRVIVVGDKVFSIAIYTTNEAKDDWRKPQHQMEAVRYEDARIDEVTAKKCARLTKKLKLNYSAIDLIEKPDGEIVFLEANVNGQFRGFEKHLKGPYISIAIAEQLLGILRHNS